MHASKKQMHLYHIFYSAGWSSLEARRAHNPKVVGSNPAPAIITSTYSVLVF